MKNCDWKNAFGPAPENFRHQLMQTLNGLEEREMKYVKKYSLKVIAVAAAIITLLVATAVAVVQGNILRTGLTNGGGEKLAAHVQDVHVTDARSDFSFTIDEVLWEEDMLFASYTVTVPEDGKLYLFSPCDLQINGQNIGYDGGIDAQFFTRMFALGGEYGVSVSQIMQMKVLEGMDNGADNQFSCSCVFMQAQKPIVLDHAVQEHGDAHCDEAGDEREKLRDDSAVAQQQANAGAQARARARTQQVG